MQQRIAAVGAVFLLILLPLYSHAETVLRVSDTISLDVDQVVDGDFYGTAFTGPVSLSGSIEGDALVFGSSVTANGSVSEDLFAAGGSVQVHASVTDDVRIAAGEVTIAEEVGGDLFVLGGVLTVLSSANIEGNVYFFGGTGELNGRIGGSVHGTSERLRIDGPVVGDVDVRVARGLVIGDRADIGGDIRYESSEELTRAQNAVVVGEVVRNSPRAPDDVGLEGMTVPLLIYAFTVLITFALLRGRLEPLLGVSLGSFTKDGLIGVAAMFALPVVIAVLFATVIGSLVGVLTLLAFLFLTLSSFVLAGMLAGLIVQKALYKSAKLDLLWTLLGVIIVSLMLFIPFIGPIALLVLMLVALGTLLRKLYEVLIG